LLDSKLQFEDHVMVWLNADTLGFSSVDKYCSRKMLVIIANVAEIKVFVINKINTL